MTTGISITNNYGSVLVDENYKNYRLVRTGSITFTPRSAYELQYVIFSGVAPMIALRGDNPNVAVGLTELTYLDGQFYAGVICGQTPATLYYYIFDLMPDEVANPGFLQVRDAQGKLTFDSNQKYLRIIDFVSGNFRTAPYRAGSTEAVVFCSPHVGQYGGSDGYSNYASGAVWRAEGGYEAWEFYMGSTDTSDGGTRPTQEPTYTYTISAMMIDVTGY